MRLTSFTDYGLRALMRLASEPGRGFSTAELADEFGISRNHLTKIVQHLARGGIVATRRGGGGGATLARPPEQIRLGAVVRLLEEGQPLVVCFGDGSDCSIDGRCRLKARLRRAEAAFMAELDQATLADIALPRLDSRAGGVGAMRLAPQGGSFQIDAQDLASLLGREPAEVRRMLRDGAITSRVERGEGEHAGTSRVTFFDGARRVRLIVDTEGEVLRRTRVPLPRRR